MQLTNNTFFNPKNHLYSKPIKGLRGYGLSYRFAFNGMEKDDEVSGAGNTMTAEFWEFDSRLGRRWNIDPVTVIGESEYSTFTNNPILFIDPNGDYSKLGAMWRNFVNGGSGISKSEATGEWGYEKHRKNKVSYKDGLTKSERQARVDEYKKTHVVNLETGKWEEKSTASGQILIKTQTQEAGASIPITYTHPLLAPIAITAIAGKLSYDIGYKIGMNIEFYSAEAAIVLSNVIPAEYLMPPSVHTKGGKQNQYDDELSPLTLEKLYELAKGASSELKRKIDRELKRRKIRNKQDRNSRGY
jgi:hypothetical protein